MSSIALIMRSKDEMPHILPALESLLRQSFTDVELWAVDSGSTDGSLDELRKEVDDAHLIQIRPEDYIPGNVLNEMIARTSANIIVFQNADAIFQSDDALEKLLRPLLDGNNADFFSAVTCAFKREIWEQTKFPESGYAEDVAWAKVCRETGARFQLVTDSVVEHSHNYTLKGLYRKKFRHGKTFANIYGRRANLIFQTLELFKEWARDFLYALSKGRLDTIPYNIAYRFVIHTGLYRGLKEGARG